MNNYHLMSKRAYSVDASASVEGTKCDGSMFDACTDDIIFDIASFLPSSDLLSLALTCKRFGARNYDTPDEMDDGGINRFNVGSIAFGPRYLQGNDTEYPTLCTILEICEAKNEIRVEFVGSLIKQWLPQAKLLSLKDFKERLRESTEDNEFHYYLEKKVSGGISCC